MDKNIKKNQIDCHLMNFSYLLLISLLLSFAYNLYERKKGAYQRRPFLINVVLIALFLAFFLWFWLTAFSRMQSKNVQVGAEVMFF